eukprot:TRINITY_DN15344_c0_g1_i1.p1 TRINITY_DN15344_c0_g1~~TRINITY_DN15344_c0_g1_i1.p1  ORF type:complete len:280 (+),score=37.99 TRINITY_DN15344_c0_g1_i1:129-968(+)
MFKGSSQQAPFEGAQEIDRANLAASTNNEFSDIGSGYLYDEVSYAPPPFVTYRRPKYGAGKATCAAVRSTFTMFFFAMALAGIGFLVWPASTEVIVKQIRLNGIDVEKDPHSSTLLPSLILHISLEMLLEVTNSNYFGVSYDSIRVRIFYRGDEIGHAMLERAEICAKCTALVPAVLDLKGQQIFKNVAALWVDTINRKIPFDTVTQFSGVVELFSWRPHIQVEAACKITVDPKDKIIVAESCSIGFDEPQNTLLAVQMTPLPAQVIPSGSEFREVINT